MNDVVGLLVLQLNPDAKLFLLQCYHNVYQCPFPLSRKAGNCISNTVELWPTPIYVFPKMKLCGLIPNSYIHVSVSDFYIPRISLPIWQQQDRQIDLINI
jgi:hypothetical protein